MFFVFANKRSIAGAATPHVASNLGPTDINLMPPYNTPFPTVNFIMSTQLGSGATTRTFMMSKPIWNADGLLDKTPSMAPHPAVNGGVVSGTFLKEASPITYSPNVLVEGAGVVRLLDDTWQNHKNSPGKVITGAMLAQILADYEKMLKEQPDPDPPEEAPPEGEEPENEDGEGDEGDDVTDEQGETDQEGEGKECYLHDATLFDGKRRESKQKLEVVGDAAIRCYANVEGACPDDAHPVWTSSTAEQKEVKGAKGAVLDFKASKHLKADWLSPTSKVPGYIGKGATAGKQGLAVYNALQSFRPKRHVITIECHEGKENPVQFEVAQYPEGELKIESLEKLFKEIKKIKDFLEKPEDLSTKPKAGASHFGLEVGTPSVDIAGEWKEWTDWRAYFYFRVDVKMDPALTGYYKWFIPWPGWAKLIEEVLEWFEIKAGPYLRFQLAFGFSIGAERNSPEGRWGFNGEFSIALGVRAGIEISAGSSFYADASGATELKQPFKFHAPKLLSPMYASRDALVLSKLTVQAVVAIAGGSVWIDKPASWGGMKKIDSWDPSEEPGWDTKFKRGAPIWHAELEGEFGEDRTLIPAGKNVKMWG